MLKKYRTEIIVFYVFAAAATVVASFFDLKIDIALNDPSNPFAVWLYRTGEFPSRLICPIAGAVIFRCTDKKAVAAIGAALCLGGSAYMGYYIGKHFFVEEYRMAFSLLWGIGFGVAALYAVRFVTVPDEFKRPLFTAAVIGVGVMTAQLLTVDIMKNLWGRVRFRDLLSSGSCDGFTAWFVINGKNGNKSFPSGHTAGAGMSYLLMLLPFIDKKREKYRAVYFWCPFIYTSAVALTRLVMGAHYLSDVAVGGVIAFSCVLVGIKVYEKTCVTNRTDI